MSSSIFCDKILVIEGGKVVAFDHHKELLKDKKSLYYKLFTTQAQITLSHKMHKSLHNR